MAQRPPIFSKVLSGLARLKIANLTALCVTGYCYIDSQIRELESLRAEEHANGASLRDLIAPVKSLPAGRNFSLSILDASRSGIPDPKMDIFALSQVCHHWRQVSHGTPAFWTTCLIRVKPTPSEVHVAGVKAWLERSSDLPLNISFTSDALQRADLPTWAQAVMPSINRRIKTLELKLRSFALLGPLFTFLLESLETLDVLSMTFTAPEFVTPQIDVAAVHASRTS
ncbi:hypothetical protein DFH07DRAFT_974139 [Mycena maculata]|uniref:F-box domain-containing protein n=1 Tax=Mycena maculata TaxID=230809 RepID=A0AAD7MFP2_9AGAR|nr:hypothetical protein DFH07DRAFT_974139 [Mycena maculata]